MKTICERNIMPKVRCRNVAEVRVGGMPTCDKCITSMKRFSNVKREPLVI